MSPLLANIYLHELDRYMERYTELPQGERQRRKRQGWGNFLYARFADDCAPRRREGVLMT